MAAFRSRLHKQLLRVSCYFRHKSVPQCCVWNHALCKNDSTQEQIARQQRLFSSKVTDLQSLSQDPYKIAEADLETLQQNIQEKIETSCQQLNDIASYYFDGKGKAFRPMIVLLMARCCNIHSEIGDCLLSAQKQIAFITEMIHTASLVHDDVIDGADTRRNKPSVNYLWGQRKAIIAGDYILAMASIALARLRNEEVVHLLSQVIEDLVRGEFMQLGSKEDENERFAHYLKKTFKKTASLLANSCKAVAVLGQCTEEIAEAAYQYGRNVGIAFQLVDDLLDFVSCDKVMGKPTAADLKLGLATAPVLFAAQSHPELNSLIMRRFCEQGDVEYARELVAKSDGVSQTRFLAEQHSLEAIKQLKHLTGSSAHTSLENVAKVLLKRIK